MIGTDVRRSNWLCRGRALAIAGAIVIAVADAAGAVQPALNRAKDLKVALEGPVQRYVEAIAVNWLLRAPHDNPAMLDMFAARDTRPYRSLLPWSGEFAGKYLTGTTQVLRTAHNETLRRATADFVRDFTNRQDADGYLGAFPRDYRLTGKAPNTGSESAPGDTWDLWNHYHAIVGLLCWYEDAHDHEALAAARRIGDLLCAKFLDTGVPVSSTGSLEMNQAVVHGLALLYKQTGEKDYLRLAEQVVEDFAAPGAGDYFRQGLAGVEFFQLPKPRWESLHPLTGLAELYLITGNEDYRQAFENLWWSIVKLDRHNNGGFSSGEQAQGNPYHPGAIETCCTIAWMAMSVDMLRLTGDPHVADELELSTFNQVVGSYSPTGRWSTYNTPMDGRRVPSTQDIAFQIRPGSEELNCCSVNAARGFGLISDWALMQADEGLTLNWYGPSTLETKLGGIAISLRQETDYPRTGVITLYVEPSAPSTFALRLRIPHWSKQSRVAVNGEAVAAEPGAYAAIEREWRSGDTVSIELDMAPRYWVGERECAGKTCVYHGPVLLALEGPAAAPPVFAGAWDAFGPSRASQDPAAKATFQFTGEAVEWRGSYFDDAGKARVSIDGKEVAIVDQYGPQRGAPFVWKEQDLGPGKHTLVLEALGEKSSASTGQWLNVSEFAVPTERPAFRTGDVAKAILHDATPTAIVEMAVRDKSGAIVTLRDFGTAGQQSAYVTWLDVEGAALAPFSKANPSRTAPAP